MSIAEKIDPIIRPALESMGYDLVRLDLVGTAQQPTLQIMAERVSDGRIGVEDCREISKTVSALLDVEDPISSAYRLEVSSPGIDRPLVALKDYVRFKGHEAKIEAPLIMENRKRFQGIIGDIKDEDIIVIEDEKGEIFEIPFGKIQKAKLVLTDRLIKAFQNQEV